ncbi:MAG: flagellar basal body-associated FliL family protein [Alphaproteobacteria bacterium]
MTDQGIDDAVSLEDEETDEQLRRKRWSGKRIVLFIVLPVLLIGGGGAGVWFSGLLDFGDAAHDGIVEEEEAPSKAVFFELPDLLINLDSSGRRTSFLKIKISLEVGSSDDVARLEAVMPRIVDNFQVYLRGLRAEDLRGSAGLYRLREELLMRIQAAASPADIRDVLFKEILVQ